jgi:pimeloyl-ACP methyl ester carboxylesterase
MLTQATLYWLTNSQAAAGRYHYEEAHRGAAPAVNTAPTGVAVFADDFQTICSLAERDNDAIVHWSEFPRGGHYASLEVPELLVSDIRTFFARLRSRNPSP